MRLQTKLLILFVPTALVAGGAVTFMTRRAVHAIILEEVEKRGLTAANDLSEALAKGFASGSERLLLPSLQSVQAKANALYAAALAPDGKVLSHTNVVETGKIYADPATRQALANDAPSSRPASFHGAPSLDIDIPVWKSEDSFLFETQKNRVRLGTLRLGIPLHSMLAVEKRIVHQVLWIVLLIGGLAMGLALLLMRSVLLPVRLLAKGAEEIGRGGYGTVVPVLSKDELGDLAVRFNQMSQALASTIAQLQEAHDKVIRSEKLAAIGQLASGVGHELRNPLGTLRNVVYYLRESLKDNPLAAQDPALKELLEQAEKEIKNATNIINDLLDFSRVVRLTLQPTDINLLLKELKGSLDVPPRVKLEVLPAEGIPRVTLDPQRINQVFINLAINAFQAMPEGGKLLIRPRMERDGDKNHPYLLVDFEDTGTGIAPEHLKNIFEPLFSTKAKGTGLGLAICQSIVEAHGGQILVSTEMGKGSTFTVKIPL